jgi:hypothetical protein
MFAITKKLILCATNNGLTAGLWHGTKLQHYVLFKQTNEDYTEFAEFLAQYVDVDIYLIVDAIEESYKLETMPHTTGRARSEILERKLGQFSRASVYRAAHFINRATDKRKDDNFLFLALNNAEFLQGWMDVIQAAHAPLVGVYLLPMLSQVVVRQMKLMAQNILLCEQSSSGLRQSYFHNGRLRMSRLMPMNEVKPNQLAYFYLVETEKTRLYLISQRLVANEAALQMVLPAVDDTHQEIAKSISQDQGIECKTVDILAYAKHNNIDAALVKTNPELLHMQLLANGNVPDNLAPGEFRKIYNLNNVRNKISLASACILAAGVLAGGYLFWQGRQLHNELQLSAQQTQQQLQQYEQVAKNFPATPIPSAELKVAAELAQIIQKNNQSPRPLMQVLSLAFEATPEIALTRVRWILSPSADVKDEAANTAPNQTEVATSSPAPNADPTTLIHVGFVNAEIRGFTGDYRAALSSVNKLVNHLRENILVESVTVLQEPVNVSSLANLQGSTTDENAATERPPAIFKLKLILKSNSNGQLTSGVTR